MNQIDILILFVVFASAAFGFFRGMVKEVLSLLTWILAIVIARVFASPLSELLKDSFTDMEKPLYFVSSAILFVSTIFVGGLIKNLVAKLVAKAGLGGVDRSLGGVFGVIRGVLIVLVIQIVISLFISIDDIDVYQQSKIAPLIQFFLSETEHIFPGVA